MRGTVILTNFEFSSTIIGKVSHLSGGFSGFGSSAKRPELYRGLRCTRQARQRLARPVTRHCDRIGKRRKEPRSPTTIPSPIHVLTHAARAAIASASQLNFQAPLVAAPG